MRASSVLSIFLAIFIPLISSGATDNNQVPRIFCGMDTDCPRGLGCYGQLNGQLFDVIGLGPTKKSEILTKKQAWITRTNSLTIGPIEEGGSCASDLECRSLHCDSQDNKCKTPKICRFGVAGEKVGVPVACSPGLIKNSKNECEVSPSLTDLPYPGLLSDSSVIEKEQCGFEISNDMKSHFISSVQSLRGAEFLFSEAKGLNDKDCLMLMPALKTLFKKFSEDRKSILKNYSQKIAEIEKESEIISGAKETDSGSAMINGRTVLLKDLAARRITGFDALFLMQRKNLILQSLEGAMLSLVQQTYGTWKGISTKFDNMKDEDTTWEIGTKRHNGSSSACRESGVFFQNLQRQLAERWSHSYDVPVNVFNAGVLKENDEFLVNYMQFILGSKGTEKFPWKDLIKDELIHGPGKRVMYEDMNAQMGTTFMADHYQDWFKSGYFLLDPLMPGLNHKDYGSYVSWEDSNAYVLRQRSMNKAGKQNLTALRNDIGDKVLQYYKSLRGEREPGQSFFYEPEILTDGGRDCIESINSESCKEFRKYIDNISDVVFAQMWAYSAHSRPNYYGYFSHPFNYRRKLIRRVEVDMLNLSSYYTALLGARDKQNACISRAVANLFSDELLRENSGGGIRPGSSARPNSSGCVQVNSSGRANSSGRINSSARVNSSGWINPSGECGPASNGGRGSGASSGGGIFSASGNYNRDVMGYEGGGSIQNSGEERSRMQTVPTIYFDLKTGESIKAPTLYETLGSVSNDPVSASTTVFANAKVASAINSRIGEIRRANQNAMKNAPVIGVGQENVKKAVSHLATSLPVGQQLGGAGAADRPIPMAVKAVLEKASEDGTDSKGAELIESNKGASAYNPLGTFSSGADATGMSNEEKNIIMKNYDRTKGRYVRDESDGLFEVLSKAYIRNLDRVLNRREEGRGQ